MGMIDTHMFTRFIISRKVETPNVMIPTQKKGMSRRMDSICIMVRNKQKHWGTIANRIVITKSQADPTGPIHG